MRRIQNVLPQLRHMKHVMQICKWWRWSNLISHITYLLWNLIRTNKMQHKFSRLQSSTNTDYLSNSKKYMIIFLKREILHYVIMITLLTTLRRFHLLLDHLYIFIYLLYNLRSEYNTLSRLIPTQWSSTPPTIQGFIWFHPNTRMETIIIVKLNQRKLVVPRTSLFQHTSPQQIFQRLDSPLCLTICLRMISRTQLQLSTKSIVQSFPKLWRKSQISILHNARRYTMQSHNLLNVHLSQHLHGMIDLHC